MIFVSGAVFAILSPRGRGRMMKALHRARVAGTRIALAPHEWPELWTSPRVMGSAVNSISMLADIVLTTVEAESFLYGDAEPEAISNRYVEWGADEVFVRVGPDRAFASGKVNVGHFTFKQGAHADRPGAAYLAARALTGSSTEAVAAISAGK